MHGEQVTERLCEPNILIIIGVSSFKKHSSYHHLFVALSKVYVFIDKEGSFYLCISYYG